MKNIFQGVQRTKPRQNKFDLSHEKKLSMNMGDLVPMLLQEVVPGDSFRVNSEIMMRLAPMIAPVMHRVNVYTHYFFVPNRLVWSEWEDFITGGEDGNAEPPYPHINITNDNKNQYYEGSLSDYMGIPIPNTGLPVLDTHVSAIPFRAYQLIYNEYFRDQNLESKVPIDKSSGQDTNQTEMRTLRKRAWEKDYFTSALPWSQRGGEAEIPLGNASIEYKEVASAIGPFGADTKGPISIEDGIIGENELLAELEAGGTAKVGIDNIEKITVDAVTINELRKANRLQKWLETSARGGSRYIEQILSHFGVKSDDARLQRPEYLGGGKQPIVISEVLNTTGIEGADGGAPQGEMAGHGISVGHSNRFSKSFKEHGFIIGIVSVLPKTAYQQGLQNHFTKFDKFDYYWPEFAHLGEQEIKVSEIYSDFTDTTAKDRVFGYQQRYAEYKYAQSSVHGDFRKSLEFWHMGRVFTSEPALNKTFIMSNPTHRIFAVEDETNDKLYVQIYNKIDALRPMPYFSIPDL